MAKKIAVIDDQVAAKLEDAIRRVLSLKGGPGIRASNTSAGITISLAPERPYNPRGPIRENDVLMKFTAVGSAFPVNTYTLQRVTGYDSSLAWPACYITDGVDVDGVNTNEFEIDTYPEVIGEGVSVTDTDGTVAQGFSGGVAGDCKVRVPLIGKCIRCTLMQDQNEAAANDELVAIFTLERSAQAD